MTTLRMTQAEFEARQSRAAATRQPATPVEMKARGTLRPTRMNKTEAEYARFLDDDVKAGLVLWYAFEGISLRLADDTRYTPDFFVMMFSGELQIRETKGGFIREDGWLKLKMAAEQYPFVFFMCQKKGKTWTTKKI